MRRIYASLTNIFVALCLAVLFFWMVYYFDTRWRFIPYTLAATATLAAVFFVFSRRFYASNYTAAIIVFAFTLVSLVKYRLIGFALHAYDFVFSGADISSMIFVAQAYPLLVLASLATIIAIVAFTIGLFKYDRPVKTHFAIRLALVPLFATATYFLHPMHNPREESYLPYIAGYNASALPLSLLYLPDILRPIPMQTETQHLTASTPLSDDVLCRAESDRPDIFMLLAESQVNPQLHPEIRFSPETIDSFRSQDGVIRDLFVESVGAGTWMTNFSVLTGIPTREFGWQAAYVTQLMESRIRGALPDILARCGYRTIAYMPFGFNALHEGAFLKSIGFQEVYDADTTGIKPMSTRDAAYFDHVRSLVEEHRATSDAPLFIHIQTMFSHQPYDSVLLPEIAEPRADTLADEKQLAEYARRIAISRADIDAYRDWMKASPGNAGSVFIEFGDHHAIATNDLDIKDGNRQEIMRNFQSDIYRTFYSIHGFGREIDFSILHPEPDAAFLTATVLAAAGLPSSPQFNELAELSRVCNGLYRDCANRQAILENLRARIDAGLIKVEKD